MINLKQIIQEIEEEKKGIWHNIRAKKARGEKPAKKGSKAYKKAEKAIKDLQDGTCECEDCSCGDKIKEAEYQGRDVKLNKPTRGDTKKFKVYVNTGKKNKDGSMKVKKVEFGARGSENRIKKSDPARRKNFRARHNCDTPGPKTKARYWSCKKW